MVSGDFHSFLDGNGFAPVACGTLFGTLWELEYWGNLARQAAYQDIFLLLPNTIIPPFQKRDKVDPVRFADLCTGQISSENQVVDGRAGRDVDFLDFSSYSFVLRNSTQ